MTLEKGKAYGQEQIQQTLQDKARTRLNNPAPHQAPQRERVSRSTIPSSARQGGGGGGGGGGAGGGGGGGGGAPRTRRWKSLIRPDVNLGVPQLMMILEPNIVWEHTKAYVGAVGREVEANVTPGEFFEGWHKGGRRAHGVYEGSYWELMGDCDELAEMLRKLSKAPALLDEPPLELPPPPELPAWDDFKPNLHLIPAAPSLPPLKLPPFRAPILEPELPFMEPEYLPLPTVPPAPKEEPLPIFIPPEFLQVEPLVEPEYVDPPPPITPESPHPPAFGQPKHGHDWSGNRPFQLDLPSRESFLADAASKRIMDTSRFVHPPNNLPRVPELEQLDIDMLRGLDLEPIPRLELAWMGGPEPDPPYASVPSSPAALSRSTSRAPSRPLSAAPSRPMSAAAPAVRPLSAAPPPPRPMSAAVSPASGGGGRGGSGSGGGPVGPSSPFASAAAAEEAEVLAAPPTASVGRPRAASASIRKTQLDSDGGAVRPWSAGPSRAAPAAADAAAAAPAAPAAAGPKTPRIRSARGGSGGLGIRTFQPPPPPPPQASVRTPEELAWEEARSVASEASGTPRMWVNFSAPFADLPPIMLPPRPEPGPEPLPEDFPHDTLEELPVYQPPALLDSPVYEEPPQFVPVWAPPCEPRPVGFLRGTAPVLLCDVSGTMNPRQQGRFRDMKRCAVDLLDPEGEIATAAVGFDVITFSGGAWSWSAGYGERMGLLQSSQVPYSGRQVGGRYSSKTPPGAGGPGSRNASPDRIGGRFGAPSSAASSFGGKGGGIALMPAQPDLLSDAQCWVANWPDAVGQTNLLAAFALAEQLHGPGADCWYVLSDGMAHDQQGCLEFLARRNDAGCMPVIHAVGFLPAEASPDTAGERFLRGIAELTGGSYQRYTPDIAKVWVAGQGFVRHELRGESPEQREERQWSERQLRAERIKNLRLGIVEPLEATMERVAVMHNQLRVAPSVRSNEAAVAEARRRHNLASESVRLTNERRLADATSSYEAALQAARARNQAKVDAAREAFLQSHGEWEREYLERVQEWEDAKATLERQREEQLAAARAAVPSPYGTPSSSGAAKPSTASASPLSPSQSQPQPYLMSSPGSSGSRPTSATRAAAFPRNRAGSLLLSPSIEPSEHRAAYAAAEYDTVHGLDRLSEKLSYSSSATPPGSRPLSAIAAAASSGGSRPVSGGGVKSDGGDGGGGAAAAAAGGASEYLEAITEDMTEASAPLDAVYTGGATAAAAAAADGALDDDGLDVRPSRGRGGGGGGGRDQDSAGRGSGGGSRISSAASAPPPSSRPLSGRASGSIGGAAAAAGGGGSVRLGSARSASSAGGGRKSSVLGSLPGAASLPLPPPPLPEPSSPLAPLRGERSDDFKRRLFPAEVVEELDATNAARLGEIRQRWEDIVNADVAANAGRRLSTMRRNAARLEEYRAAVYDTYANGLIRDVVYGGAVRVAANLALMDNAEAAYLAEVERINAENDRLRALHTAEVEERRAKEGVHAQAVRRWQEGQEAAQRQHEADREKARAEHEANITRLKAEWRAKTQQVLELNDARLTEAEAMHEALTDQIKETNRQHKEEHTEALRQRREVEATNLSRLAEAKAVHKVRLESRAADNERLIRNSMEEHQALCVRLAEEYEENKAQSEVDHSELVAFLRAANEQLTEEARRRYQEALAEVQAAYEAECAEVREAHARELERVKRFNVEIWPKVHVARLAQAELARVQLFAEHIRFCANKFEMGVNFVPNTPNYDRVVEMQALTEALSKAFPDVAPNSLPWPDHERRLEPGTGWVAAPAARNLTYRDPMDIINKIAKGKPINLSSNQGNSNGPSRGDSPAPPTSRGHSAGPAGAVGAAADGGDAAAGSLTSGGSTDEALSPQHTQHPIPYGSSSSYTPRHLTRPLSAGRARFANVLGGIGGGGESSYGYGSQRPMSAAVPAPSSARVEAWGNAAAAAASALSSPGGPLRPNSAAGGSGGGGGGYQNPSAWRRSNTSVLRAGSPRLPSTYAASNFGGGGGGGPSSTAGGVAASSTLASAVAAAAAATAAMGALGSRPGTARPGTAHGSVGGGGLGSSRPRSAGPGPRPPARVAVDVTSLQASVARSKAQAGAHMLTSAALAGFSKDVPKLRYPEVDVPQALTIASSLRSS